jgi:hypothetical protein
VAGTVIAVLAFVVGIFDDDSGKPNPESTPTTRPVIESLAYVPPSEIDAAGISAPVSKGEAIYLFARRPKNGELVASTAARLSERDDELRWRALLDLGRTKLAFGVESGDRSGPYEVVAAVMPKVRSPQGGSPYATNYSSSAAAGGLDLDAAEAVSAPRLVRVP